MNNRPETLFIDIDGVLLRHLGNMTNIIQQQPEVLPDVQAKFNEWDKKGYNIILTTGRRESIRALTEKQLQEAGLFYDMLIMGLGGGNRRLINDLKSDSLEPTATAHVVERNKGLGEINI
jgi:hydroxymethylpyrimidine pyrophosphatase-like HAD family hydrolase